MTVHTRTWVAAHCHPILHFTSPSLAPPSHAHAPPLQVRPILGNKDSFKSKLMPKIFAHLGDSLLVGPPPPFLHPPHTQPHDFRTPVPQFCDRRPALLTLGLGLGSC
jgi:hypothetical protein